MTNPYGAEPPPAENYGAWPYGPPAVPTREAPTGLAIASVVVALLLLLAQLVTTAASFGYADQVRDELERGDLAPLTLYDLVGLLTLPAMIAAYVVNCIWLQAARKNAEAISPSAPQARGPVWVWLGWWVPIVSFWFPYQVVRDVRDASARSTARIGLGLWWTTWLVFIIGSRVTAQVAGSSDIDTVGTLPFWESIAAVAAIVACVRWIQIVRSITGDQSAALTAR